MNNFTTRVLRKFMRLYGKPQTIGMSSNTLNNMKPSKIKHLFREDPTLNDDEVAFNFPPMPALSQEIEHPWYMGISEGKVK